MKQVDTKNSRYNASVGHEVRDGAGRCQATASLWNLHFTSKPTIAELKMSTVVTRAGNKKPAYELLDLRPMDPPAPPTPVAPKDQK